MARDASSAADGDFEANVNKKLQSLNDRQDSIQTMSLWVIHHKAHCTQIAAAWISAMKKAIPAKKRLTLFYLLNDVLQNCKRKNAKIYLLAFKPYLKDAVLCVRTPDIRPKVERMLSIWEERGVFTQDYTSELKDVLTRGEEGRDNVTDQLIDNFKPSEFSAAVTELKRYEDEVAVKHKQLLQIHLDATSAEATKALKDRTNSKQFAMQFEESCVKMEEYVAALQKEIKDRTQFMEKLEQAQLFYETQWNESQVVVKAYKNFGIRVKNLKKRLDDYLASRQDSDAACSPVPLSAVADAPSPGNTPPPDPSQDNVESIDMDLSDEESDAATGGIVSVSPVKAKGAVTDAPSVTGSKPSAALQLPATTAEWAPLGNTAPGTRLPSASSAQQQLLPPLTAASSPIVSPIAMSKPAVYDPRQAYNPAYHLQPKPVAALTVSTVTAALTPSAALAAAAGSHGLPQAESVSLSKVLGAMAAGGRPTPAGVPPPLPVQPPLPAAAALPATAAPGAAGASIPTGAAASASAGAPANPGIELLRKLINQAGASPSQNTSVLESLTSFALTVKALTTPKKDEGSAAAATPATWSDWKRKQMEDDDDDSRAAPGSAATGAAPVQGLAVPSTLLQPQRPMPPALVPDRFADGHPAAYPNLPGTFLPRVNSFPPPIEASKFGGAGISMLPSGFAPLAPPPPLPALLSNRMSNATSPGAGTATSAAAAGTSAGLPALLPPQPPAGMHPFDVPTLLPPVHPYERQLSLTGHYAPSLPQMPPLPSEFEKGLPTIPPRDRPLASPTPLSAMVAQASGNVGATPTVSGSARSPPPLTSPAVQAVLAKLKLPIPGGRPVPAAAVGREDSAAACNMLTTPNLLGVAAMSGSAAAPVPATAATTTPFHFSTRPSSPLTAGMGQPPAPTAAVGATTAQQLAPLVPSSPAAQAVTVAATLPPAIMAVLTSGLSKSKDPAASVPSAAATQQLPLKPAPSVGEALTEDAHHRQASVPMETTTDATVTPGDTAGGSWSGSSVGSASSASLMAELATRDIGRPAAVDSVGSPEQTSPAGDRRPLPNAARVSDMEPAAEAAAASSSSSGGADTIVGAPVPAAVAAADQAEEFYPIQSLASIRKPDHFDRRGGHFRRDQRRGMLAFGGGEPLPPGMADYYNHHHGGFGADQFVGGRAGHRPRDFGHGPRRNYDHSRGGMPYSFHPY